MPRPSSVLDGNRSGDETLGFPKLLQQVSRSWVAGESNANSYCGIQTGQSQMLCVAETLSRFIPNANSRVRTNSPSTGSDPSVTDYVLEQLAKCPQRSREIL